MIRTTDNPASRAAHLRELAAAWGDELRAMGPRPRTTTWAAPWRERSAAIAGALAEAQVLDGAGAPKASVEQQVAQLRGAGLTFAAVAAALRIPIGSAKTFARRAD